MENFKAYIYEVRGCNDPIDGDTVRFETKVEALEYADNYPCEGVYMVEVEQDSDSEAWTPTGTEIQIKGPEVDSVVAQSDADHNSCVDCDVEGEMSAVFTQDDLAADDPIPLDLTPLEDFDDEPFVEAAEDPINCNEVKKTCDNREISKRVLDKLDTEAVDPELDDDLDLDGLEDLGEELFTELAKRNNG